MKHVGKMKNNSARIVVIYRTVPGESNNCLVVGTQGLSDSYHDSLMALIEGDSGQQANDLADLLAVRKFPDGSNMLQYLHVNGHLKKVPTHMVLMTPNTQSTIQLDELNALIAKQKGISVDDSSTTNNTKVEVKEETIPVKLTPAEMRSRADALYKEAAKLRKEADELDPPKKKSKTEKSLVE